MKNILSVYYSVKKYKSVSMSEVKVSRPLDHGTRCGRKKRTAKIQKNKSSIEEVATVQGSQWRPEA